MNDNKKLMCFPRKASLGRYNASRGEWRLAYRAARTAQRIGVEPDPATSGILWKTSLIVAYERADYNDLLMHPIASRLESKRILGKIVSNQT